MSDGCTASPARRGGAGTCRAPGRRPQSRWFPAQAGAQSAGEPGMAARTPRSRLTTLRRAAAAAAAALALAALAAGGSRRQQAANKRPASRQHLQRHRVERLVLLPGVAALRVSRLVPNAGIHPATAGTPGQHGKQASGKLHQPAGHCMHRVWPTEARHAPTKLPASRTHLTSSRSISGAPRPCPGRSPNLVRSKPGGSGQEVMF